MSKVKIKFKLTGLEFEIEADRADVPAITQNLAGQLGNMLSPTANIAQGIKPALEHRKPPQPAEAEVETKPRKKGTRGNKSSEKIKAVDFTHDGQTWGNPSQDWSLLEKSIWLLFVVKSQGSVGEMSATEIAETFNKHFRQSGTIRPSNVSRDLGKAKTQAPAKVGEDTTKTPTKWYLNTEGEKTANELVNQGRGLKG